MMKTSFTLKWFLIAHRNPGRAVKGKIESPGGQKRAAGGSFGAVGGIFQTPYGQFRAVIDRFDGSFGN